MTVNPEIGYQWKIHNFDWIIMKLGKIAEYQLDCVKIVIFLNNGQFLVLLSFLMRHTLLSLVYQFSFYNNRNQILRNGLYEIVLPKIFDLMVIFFFADNCVNYNFRRDRGQFIGLFWKYWWQMATSIPNALVDLLWYKNNLIDFF